MFIQLKIRQRLILGFGFVLAMLVLSAFIALSRMETMSENLTKIVKVFQKEQEHAFAMELSTQKVQRFIRTILLSDDPKEISENQQKILEARKAYDEASSDLERLLVSEEAKAQFAKISAERDEARRLNSQSLQWALEGRKKDATALLLGQARQSTAAWAKALEDLSGFLDRQMTKKYEEAEAAYQGARSLMITLSLLAVGAGIVAAILITRSISSPIQRFVNTMSETAAGDLTVVALVESKDELGELGNALNDMLGQLRSSFLEIQEVTFNVAQASGEISSGNSDLSRRTESQAANLEETASAMEEFTTSLNHTAENAVEARKASGQAEDVAERGGAAVKELVSSMGEINASSQRIAEIINVVDEIAFQTNLLALNAAVEAARAGEQGRGFAVVASEVRNLAKRSADAAKEIKALIKDSVAKAQHGQKVADQAGGSMIAIVEQVRRTSELIAEIANAAREQNAGVIEINKAMMQMDNGTQQNAALVEEAAASAESLDEQAQALANIVGRFKTGAEGQRSRAAGARRQAPRQGSRFDALSARPSRPALSPSQPVPEEGDWESF